ncbi:RdRP-domain-containing protein [Aureobasidium subglaciale]|nr:RdRP-domain-containing protein [Aureobasidium subglaciale]
MAENTGPGEGPPSSRKLAAKLGPHRRLSPSARPTSSLARQASTPLATVTNQPRPAPLHPARETVTYNARGLPVASSRRNAPMSRPPRAPPQLAMQFDDSRRLNRTTKPWEPTWIKIEGISPGRCNPIDVHRILFEFGHVSLIDCRSNHTASALLLFTRDAFFKSRLFCGTRELTITTWPYIHKEIPYPADPTRKIKKSTIIPVEQIEFGVMTGDRQMMTMHTASSTKHHPAILMLDLANRPVLELRFFVTTEHEAPWYRAEFRLSSPLKIVQTQHEDGQKEIIITSQFPPIWWQTVGRGLLKEIYQDKPNKDLQEFRDWPRGWRRVTDIDLNPEERDLNPVSFVPLSPVVDTGRWLTWRLKFPASVDDSAYYTILEVLEDHNADIRSCSPADFESIPREDPIVWALLDPHRASHDSDLHEMQDDMMHLDQDIRYQLEVCISNNNIVEYTLTQQFLLELSALDRGFSRDINNPSTISPALVILENVADSNRTYYNPMDIFATYDLRHPRKRRVPRGCTLMRTAVITPTTFYVKTPSVEVSNRVIRDNFFAAGNFLRVKFEDEDPSGSLRPTARYENQHEVWARIERCLRHGIDIAGRHYDWLACGNSQFRERGAYFFTPYSDEKTARNIRMALGDFSAINVVAKCMARIGQCFSTTRASTNIGKVDNTMIRDVERNGYCFTDGVGKVSPFVAQMVANELYTDCGPHDYPSAFQFRMGGFKGILVVDPALKGRQVLLRPSQRKFNATSVGLEIIKPSKFLSSTLNQQIILVLTGRGVPKQVFIDKMTKELGDINMAMNDENMALKMLQQNVDFNQITLTISGLILDGFMHSDEPMCKILLQLWRAWSLKFLKEKAKLFVEKGAFVLGCVDETNTLKMAPKQLPEIFIQVPAEREGQWIIVQGICLLARNPSLHPGDIRVVKAVDCKALKHLKNIVVLPQQGERPLANMCAGGDLDGDDYLVMWDDDLLPPKSRWECEPMNYDPPTPVTCIGAVQDEHFFKFFVDYIKYDNIGPIATNHRAIADRETANGGVGHKDCTDLAQLHSQAVDFNKTGVPARVPESLWPNKFPHWMEAKPKNKHYTSKEVLGLLYDMVQPEKFTPQLEKPFDQRILNAYVMTEAMLSKAREFKIAYDQQIRRVMAQHNIRTEFEVWTAFVMDHNREKHWYSLAEDLGNLMSAIKSDFQAQVREHLQLADTGYMGGEQAFGILGPFVATMYTITAQEVRQWKENKQGSIDRDLSNAPLISYPWLFSRELGKIATNQSGPSLLSSTFGGEIRRRTPVVKSSYKANLGGLKLEPLEEWKPEHNVDDHVGTAFDVAESPKKEVAAEQDTLKEELSNEMSNGEGVVHTVEEATRTEEGTLQTQEGTLQAEQGASHTDEAAMEAPDNALDRLMAMHF